MRRSPSIVTVATQAGVALLALGFVSACEMPVTSPDGDGLSAAPRPLFSHGAFTSSAGIYRIPYVDGSSVTVSNDHHDHNPVNRIDMSGDNPNFLIVAAASGTIRAIVDWHGNSPGAGDGLGSDGVTPQFNAGDDSLEHSCQDPQDAANNPIPNAIVVGICQQYNNYVWIEHPNGEWTKYTHLGTGTVTANNWSVGDWINAGEVLGIEGDVGRASGRHLHFEVGLPNNPTDLTPFTALGGFMVFSGGFGVNLVPQVCDAGDVGYLYQSGVTYVANPCTNAPPVANPGGPYEVDEGSAVILDGSGSFDPDGLPLTYAWSPAAMLSDSSAVQPSFVTSDDGFVNVTLSVFDQVEAIWDSVTTTVTINNVAPIVTIDPAQVAVVDEGDQLLVTADFLDPGVLDAPFTAKIRCWATATDSVVVDAAVNVTGTDGPLTGTASAYCPFGDTSQSGAPATGTFEVVVRVADKDGGEGEASFNVTVVNTAPAPAIDVSGAENINGVPTFIATIGETLGFSADVTDDGSDDLSLTWNWGDGSTDQATYLLDPPAGDPFPSPDENPRDISDQQSHAWAGACFFVVTLTARDDDGAEASDSANVIIAGNSGRARGPGYWLPQYRGNRSNGFSAETLSCYLAIAGHMSAVFDEGRSGTGSFTEAVAVLHTGGSKGNIVEELDQQLLAAWLNFADGAFGWTDPVDTTGDGVADTAFSSAITTAESVRLNPNAGAVELEEQKNVLEAINLMHGG